jgi:hypothetical protein
MKFCQCWCVALPVPKYVNPRCVGVAFELAADASDSSSSDVTIPGQLGGKEPITAFTETKKQVLVRGQSWSNVQPDYCPQNLCSAFLSYFSYDELMLLWNSWARLNHYKCWSSKSDKSKKIYIAEVQSQLSNILWIKLLNPELMLLWEAFLVQSALAKHGWVESGLLVGQSICSRALLIVRRPARLFREDIQYKLSTIFKAIKS